MRFCMITTFYPPYSFGGDAIYLYRLCNELARHGHTVDVIHCADSFRLYRPEPTGNSYPNEHGVTVHTLRSGVGPLSPLLSHQTGRPFLKSAAIRQVLESRGFDVIHYHNISLFGPEVLAIEPSYSGWVKLYTMHEHWLVCPMNVLWKFNSRVCESPECLRCTVVSKRPPQWWRYTGLRDRAARHVDQFLSPSRFTRDMHHQRGFPYPIEQLPYFLHHVDDDWRVPGPSPSDRPYFLFVGRLEMIKGVQNILDEFAGEGDFDLLVIGSGDYEAELRRRAAGMQRVKFAGWVSQKQIGPYYRHALGVLVPSVTYETFGIVIIEAFARKTPVIAHDLGALPEVVEDSGGGFTYRTRDQLRGAMAALAANPAMRKSLGEAGYQAFCKHWSARPHLQRYFQLIENVSNRKYRKFEVQEKQICRGF